MEHNKMNNQTLPTLTFTFESFGNWLTHAVCGKHNATVSIKIKSISIGIYIS